MLLTGEFHELPSNEIWSMKSRKRICMTKHYCVSGCFLVSRLNDDCTRWHFALSALRSCSVRFSVSLCLSLLFVDAYFPVSNDASNRFGNSIKRPNRSSRGRRRFSICRRVDQHVPSPRVKRNAQFRLPPPPLPRC